MLTKITQEELDRYVDWAYSIALDLAHSGYPTYADGIKTREDFRQDARESFNRKRDEILLFRVDDEVCGWIHWYWLPNDSYAQTSCFLTASHTDLALGEFIAYAASKHPSYALHMGFPVENIEAIQWLEQHGFRLVERSVHNTLFLDRCTLREAPDDVSRMDGSEDEAAFRALHTATDMYWTAKRILAHPADWRIYLYCTDGHATAALYAHTSPDGEMEVFGLCGDITPESYDDLITFCIRDAKAVGSPHLTYFEENEQMLPRLAALGFEQVSRYVCYQKTL